MVFKIIPKIMLCFLALPIFCAADSFSPSLLVGHVKILQEIKERFLNQANKIKPSKTAKSPTQAHFNAMTKTADSWSKKSIEDNQKTYKKMFDQVVLREQEYGESHYVFYHGQRSVFRLWQDVLKEIYSFVHIHCPLKEFEFFRAWFDTEKSFEANHFIDDYEAKKREEHKKYGSYSYHPDSGTVAWMDHEPYLSKNMLCANLSFFGNFTSSGESSFWYFKKNMNIGYTNSEEFLKALWKEFGFDNAYIKKIIALDALIKTDEGSILQIFIPKNEVDKYAFICKPFGTPIREVIDAASFDAKKKRHTKISPILEKYISNPESISKFDHFSNFDHLQARLLLSQDCIINPTGGIKIFRYTTVPDAKMAQFQKELRVLINQMLKEWVVSSEITTKAKDTKISRLLDCIKAACLGK